MGIVGAVAQVQRLLRPGVEHVDFHILHAGEGAPILLQSGFTMDPQAHTALVKKLAESGRPVWGVAAPCRTTGDVDGLAARFGRALQAAHDSTGERATVVAHSYGGLISRKFMQENEGFRLADQLITIGSPHGGMDFFHPMLHKLADNVGIPGLRSLSEKHGPAQELNAGLKSFMADAHAHDPNFQFISIVGKGLLGGDGLVPEASTLLPKVRGVHVATFKRGLWRNHGTQAGIGPKLDPRIGHLLLRIVRPSTGVEAPMSARMGALIIKPQ